MDNRNSLVTHLSAYYRAMFKDIAWLYGTKVKELERDCSRLLSELDRKGPRIAAIDLPAVAKHFDQCLDHGQLTNSGGHLTMFVSKGVRIPKFLRVLHQLIWDNDGKLRLDADIDAIVAIRQMYMGLKKLRLTCSDDSINQEVRNFVDIERDNRVPSLRWDEPCLDYDRRALRFEDAVSCEDGSTLHGQSKSDLLEWCRILHITCDIITSSFGNLHHEDEGELPKHGPGVVSNQKKSESKYSFPFWPERLESVFPFDRYAVANSGLLHDDQTSVSRRESASRLIAVPKTLKAPRLIAAEPVEHQWIQQLVRNQLERRLRNTPLRACIDFSSQMRNQKLALSSSRDAKYATVDLSSASDRLTCWFVERAFRSNPTLLSRLMACRTQVVTNAVSAEVFSEMKITKFAAMGSAVTFPVQSILYACAAIAVSLPMWKRRYTSYDVENAAQQVQVFGDDIVVATDKCQSLIALLTLMGLKVNRDKTFTGSNFRESCGVDAFRGHNVTPVYIARVSERAKLGFVASAVANVNNLFMAGYWFTADCLKEQVKWLSGRIPVLRSSDTKFGLLCFSGESVSHLKSRWNKDLHFREYRTAVPTMTVDTIRQDSWSSLLQYYTERPAADTNWQSGLRRKGDVKLRLGWTQLV